MVTVNSILEAWWVEYRPTIAETTIHRKQQIIALHIAPYIGTIAVRRLAPDDLDYLRSKSAHTQLEVRKILNPALRWAVKHKYCKRNVMDAVPRPKYYPANVEIYTPQELDALLSYLEGRWLWLPVYLASRTGLRRGEVCGLQWEDIDLERGYLMVKRTISAVSSHELYVRMPKTKKSRRRVDLDPYTVRVLAERKSIAKSEWVCEAPRRPGGMPNPWHITKLLHDACIAAGIPHHTFHALRHTHATILLAENVRVKIVSERLGHSNSQITDDVYSHVLPTMQEPAVAAVTKFFSKSK